MSHPLELAPYTIGIQMQNTASEAGKGAFPHLIPFPAPPPRFSPAAAYLSRLAPSSQLTMTKLLGCLVELLGSSTPAEEFPWAHLDYGRAIRLRQTLASRYAPATANLALCALRGVLREAWRLGDMSYESFRRVSDLAQVRGDRPSPRRSIDTRSDETLRGRRDLAILSVLYGTGLRRSELTHLDLAHVERDRLMVYGKGRQRRIARLGQDATAALGSWLELRGTAPGALFSPIHRSGALRPRRLSTEAAARITERLTAGDIFPIAREQSLLLHNRETRQRLPCLATTWCWSLDGRGPIARGIHCNGHMSWNNLPCSFTRSCVMHQNDIPYQQHEVDEIRTLTERGFAAEKHISALCIPHLMLWANRSALHSNLTNLLKAELQKGSQLGKLSTMMPYTDRTVMCRPLGIPFFGKAARPDRESVSTVRIPDLEHLAGDTFTFRNQQLESATRIFNN